MVGANWRTKWLSKLKFQPNPLKYPRTKATADRGNTIVGSFRKSASNLFRLFVESGMSDLKSREH